MENQLMQRTRRAAVFAVVVAAIVAGISWRLSEPPRPGAERPTTSPRSNSPLASPTDRTGDAASQAEVEAMVAASKTIISVSPDPLAGESSPSAAERPLPPELELARRASLASWKRQAARSLRRCLLEEGASRLGDQQIELRALFAADPRPQPGQPQSLRPQWVSASPDVLRRLAERFSPRAVTTCLGELRGLAYAIPLGDHSANVPPAPMAMERFTAAL